MRNLVWRSLVAGGLIFAGPTPLLWAGMPTVKLSEYGIHRVSTFSFFLFGFLISTFVIYKVWNSLQKDFEKLPRLSYKSALLATTIWGVMFVLVLTMISGARELMTPGAWDQHGATYKLKQPTVEQITPEAEQLLVQERRLKLERLQGLLWVYALQHDGKFPESIEASEFLIEHWQVPEQFEIQYLYEPQEKPTANTAAAPLVIEPNIVGSPRYVMFTDGSISLLESEMLHKVLNPEETPQEETIEEVSGNE
ncbi:MAG: hypothetical protein R3C11_28500 [Planctomycetaceae bacterium]